MRMLITVFSTLAIIFTGSLSLSATQEDNSFYDDYSYGVGDENFGGTATFSAEITQDGGYTGARAIGSGDVRLFGEDYTVLEIVANSQVNDGSSSNSFTVDVVTPTSLIIGGLTRIYSANHSMGFEVNWSETADFFTISYPVPYTFGLMSADLSLQGEVYANAGVGLALPGVGVGGNIGARVGVSASISLEFFNPVDLYWYKGSVVADLWLIDSYLHAGLTISPINGMEALAQFVTEALTLHLSAVVEYWEDDEWVFWDSNTWISLNYDTYTYTFLDIQHCPQEGQCWIPNEEETPIVPGDVNGDTNVDVLDIVAMVAYINGNGDFTNEQFLAADVNNDGKVDVLDIVTTMSQLIMP